MRPGEHDQSDARVTGGVGGRASRLRVGNGSFRSISRAERCGEECLAEPGSAVGADRHCGNLPPKVLRDSLGTEVFDPASPPVGPERPLYNPCI